MTQSWVVGRKSLKIDSVSTKSPGSHRVKDERSSFQYDSNIFEHRYTITQDDASIIRSIYLSSPLSSNDITSYPKSTMNGRIYMTTLSFVLLWAVSLAFQISAPYVVTKVSPPLLPTIATMVLHYKNGDEDSGGTDDNTLKLKTPLQQTIVSPEATELKGQLVKKIFEFRKIKQRDQPLTISNKIRRSASRLPQKIDFHAISSDLENKSQEIVELCHELAKHSPIKEPTKFLGDPQLGGLAPLEGAWRSLFTTAADADFPQRVDQGPPRVQNIVNAKKGIITNVVDFPQKVHGTDPLLQQLNVVIRAKSVSANRVELQFKYAKAILTKLLWFKFKWNLYIPVPPPIVVRCLVLVSRLVKFGRKGTSRVPKAYFDILYLDGDLRVHRTGEDNYFVQAKDHWNAALPLLE
jgi:hypothetical protein